MRKFCLKLVLLFSVFCAFAQTKPLYKLPDTPPEKKGVDSMPFLVGTDSGLYQITNGKSSELWADGSVSKILRTTPTDASGNPSVKWYFLTSKGVVSSVDLKSFTECNNGLPTLTIKEFENGKKSLVKQVPLLKGLCADPIDQNILVTATKDAVYITRDGGKNWASLGSTSKNTAGIKTVAVAHMPTYSSTGEISGSSLVAFMSHSIYGFSYCYADSKNPTWNDVSKGFAAISNMTQVDEIGAILPVLCGNQDGSFYVDLYCSQTYIPKIYHFDWRNKKAELVYSGNAAIETNDGLCQVNDSIYFATLGEVKGISMETGKTVELPARYSSWKKQMYAAPGLLNTAFVPPKTTDLAQPLQLSELWLLTPDKSTSPYADSISDKKAVYISAYQVREMKGITKYRNIVKNNKLNAVVVDMKDDSGLLRFTPKSDLLKEKGYVSAYKMDIDQFVSEFKKDGVYLIGRVVVFKDKNLTEYANGKYAIWNSSTNRPWVGIKSIDGNGVASYYGENWVDPYSEEVWEYNVAVANELIERGFDEVQFDYIRFPTDGINMGSAQYRWKDSGMDKESALMSFLAYARKNVKGPIGIDIYGANGWYRSGTRTGQDVEMLSQYVDVICPMFYPSHFEQNFLESSPVVERPYRIYFYGTYRNTVIGRNKIVVRPWVQAFYMGVRYDKAYYDKNYVKREIFGVRDSVNRGYMYWNNSGGMYDDISPDPTDTELSPWHQNESDLQPRLPGFSSPKELVEENKSLLSAAKPKAAETDFAEKISIWDSILYPVQDEPEVTAVDTAAKKVAMGNAGN